MEKGYFIKTKDKSQIYIRKWDIDEPKAVVQIFHGMNEHSGRYAEFAGFLNERGYAVYADDHRGHGMTAKSQGNIGYIGVDGFQHMIEDVLLLSKMIEKEHPGIPLYILGHSMGSFLAQRYIQLNGKNIAGVILVGSGGNRKDIGLGILVAFLVERFNKDKRSRGIERIVFKGFNSRFDKRSRFEWIASDNRVVDAYLNDPFCGHVFPPSFYKQFLGFLELLFNPKNMEMVPLELPMLILSGEDDPVGEFGEGIRRLYRQFKEFGMKDLEYKLYEDVRHEILNDGSKQTVYEDIASWLDKRTSSVRRFQNPSG